GPAVRPASCLNSRQRPFNAALPTPHAQPTLGGTRKQSTPPVIRDSPYGAATRAEPPLNRDRLLGLSPRARRMSDTVADPSFDPPEDAVAFYEEALGLLKESGIPFLLSGTYAVTAYTGI